MMDHTCNLPRQKNFCEFEFKVSLGYLLGPVFKEENGVPLFVVVHTCNHSTWKVKVGGSVQCQILLKNESEASLSYTRTYVKQTNKSNTKTQQACAVLSCSHFPRSTVRLVLRGASFD